MSGFKIDYIMNYQGVLTLEVAKCWIGSLFSEICTMRTTINENKITIDNLTKKVEELQAPQPTNNPLPRSYSSVTAKKTVADRQIDAAIVNLVSRNDKE